MLTPEYLAATPDALVELYGKIEQDILANMAERIAKYDYYNTPKSPYPDGDTSILECPCCGSGEWLHNADESAANFCGQCGQAIDWTEPEVHCGDCEHLTFSDCYGECGKGYKGIVQPGDSCGKGEHK